MVGEALVALHEHLKQRVGRLPRGRARLSGRFLLVHPLIRDAQRFRVDAPAGKWDFLAVPHSSRILKVQTAAGIPTAVVTAALVREHKHAYVVRYHVANRAAGDTVTIEETDSTGAPIPVATLRRGRGTIDWTPSAKLFRPVRVLLAVIKRHGSVVLAEPLLGVNLKKHTVIKPKTGKPKHKRGKTGKPKHK
jgi:hypothetical protein